MNMTAHIEDALRRRAAIIAALMELDQRRVELRERQLVVEGELMAYQRLADTPAPPEPPGPPPGAS